MPDLADTLTRPLTPAQFWEAVYQQKYTGPLVIHFAGGVPTVVEIPPARPRDPIKVRLVMDAGSQPGLDKRGHSGHADSVDG